MNVFKLSREFWDFAFENPEKIKPIHIAIYFYSIEINNRLGWKDKFALPTDVTMEAIGLKTYKSYITALLELVEFKFVTLIERSKNQFTSNIISLDVNSKPESKSLSKALTLQQNQKPSMIKEDEFDFLSLDTKPDPILESEIYLKCCDYFSQKTDRLKMQLFGDLKRIERANELFEFTSQTLAYIKYKTSSQEKIHGWQSYLTEYKNTDWVDKLNKFSLSNKSNQKEFEKKEPKKVLKSAI